MSSFSTAEGTPIIDEDALAEWVRADFGVSLRSMSQLSGGQDSDAVLIRGVTVDGVVLAVKVSHQIRIGGLRPR